MRKIWAIKAYYWQKINKIYFIILFFFDKDVKHMS